MKYHEAVKIRPECATCPTLCTLAEVYTLLDDAREELSLGIMDGEVNKGLFASLLEDGMGIGEAEQWMVDNATRIHAENIAALEDMDSKVVDLTSLGVILQLSCMPVGAVTDATDPGV